MNTISSFSVKLTALQMAIEAKPHDVRPVMEIADEIYIWLAAEIEFEQPEGSVTTLRPVN